MCDTKMEPCGATTQPCPTCLTYGRAMLPVRNASQAYIMLLPGHEIDPVIPTSMQVCWECHGTLNRILKFQKQVLEANRLLNVSFQYLSCDQKTAIKSLSSLSNTTKSIFDYEFQEDNDSDDADWDVPVSTLQVKVEQATNAEPGLPRNDTQPAVTRSKKAKRKKNVTTKRKTKKSQTQKKINGKRDVVTWPGRRVLLKGGKNNVRIVSITMSEDDMLRYRNEDRASRQFSDARFKCALCIKVFSNENVLVRHNSTHHNQEIGPYKCEICDTYFSIQKRMKRHQRGHYSMYVCSECGFTNRVLENVVHHHTAAHEPGKTYPCDHCEKVFTTGRKMRYHRDAAHKNLHQCEHCDKILSNSASLKCHLLIHTGMTTFECSVCHKGCRGESGLYSHMRTVHKQETGQDTYCVDCGIQFKTKYNYKAHLRISVKHASPAQLKFPCTKCNKKCISETALRQHDRYYHQEYVCHFCNKRHNNWYTLDKHIKFKHEGRELPRKHICEACGKAFTTKGALQRHQLIHTGERPHACDICGTKFAQKSTLNTHQKLVHFKT